MTSTRTESRGELAKPPRPFFPFELTNSLPFPLVVVLRSKRETNRLHSIQKSQNPLPKASVKGRRARSPSVADTVSTIDSHPSEAPSDLSDDQDAAGFNDSQDEEPTDDSDMEDFDSEADLDDVDLDIPLPHQVASKKKKKKSADEEEADYENATLRRTYNRGDGSDSDSQDPSKGTNVKRLPIKLPSGQIESLPGTAHVPSQLKKRPEPKQEEDSDVEMHDEEPVEGQGLGKRWGRMAVAEVVTIKDPAQRKRAVKEQIASLGAEIVSGGEVVDNVSPSSSSFSFESRLAKLTPIRLAPLSPDSPHHPTLLLRSPHRP